MPLFVPPHACNSRLKARDGVGATLDYVRASLSCSVVVMLIAHSHTACTSRKTRSTWNVSTKTARATSASFSDTDDGGGSGRRTYVGMVHVCVCARAVYSRVKLTARAHRLVSCGGACTRARFEPTTVHLVFIVCATRTHARTHARAHAHTHARRRTFPRACTHTSVHAHMNPRPMCNGAPSAQTHADSRTDGAAIHFFALFTSLRSYLPGDGACW